jgi:hypothetical protein
MFTKENTVVSKKFTDRGDVEKTIKENHLWKNLSKDEFRAHLKRMLETHQSLTDDAKEYIRERLKALD